MHILILNPIFYTSETANIQKQDSIKDTLMYNNALAFKKLGHSVTLIAAEEYRPLVEETYEFEILYFPSIIKKIFLPNLLPLPKGLYTFLKKNSKKYDFIITSESFSFYSLYSSILASKKTIIWQEIDKHQKKFFNLPSIFWHHIVFPLFLKKSYVVSRSESAFHFIKQYSKNAIPEKIDHGINLEKFTYNTQKEKQFVVVGRLTKKKNIESVIRIFLKFKKKYATEHQLLIIGEGDFKEELEHLVHTLNLEKEILFLGFKKHKELNYIISSSEALLTDTKKDLNVVVISEAIVSGTPVLTNLIPVSATDIDKNKLGIAKENWNEDDLYHISKENTAFVENCIKYRDELSSKTTAKKFIKLYLQIIKK